MKPARKLLPPLAALGLLLAARGPEAWAVLACPSDMRLYGTAGAPGSFCIDLLRHSHALTTVIIKEPYLTAVNDCIQVGRSLCNADEWQTMCHNSDPKDSSTLDPDAVGGVYAEWVSNSVESASERFSNDPGAGSGFIGKFVVGGPNPPAAGSCATLTQGYVGGGGTNDQYYRCCLR